MGAAWQGCSRERAKGYRHLHHVVQEGRTANAHGGAAGLQGQLVSAMAHPAGLDIQAAALLGNELRSHGSTSIMGRRGRWQQSLAC